MKHATRLFLAALLAACASAAGAQDYPNRLVTIIVPYPAGGPTDQIARELAARLLRKAQTEFRGRERERRRHHDRHRPRCPGDAGRLHVAAAQSANLRQRSALSKSRVRYREGPRAGRLHQPESLVLTGRKSLTPSTLGELIALMKREPLKMAHPGTGSTGHLATSLFTKEAKVEAIQVPYRGAAPALQDIAGDHVDLFFATPQSVVEQVAAGQIKAYGITAKQESPLFPKVASFVTEMGPRFNSLLARAVRAGRNTSAGDRQAQRGFATGRGRSAVVKAWAAPGVAPYPKDQRSPQAAQALLHSEIARWAQVVRENNIKPPGQ